MVVDDEELDAVARLAEHLQNLPASPRARPRVAVIGLPAPPLGAALGVGPLLEAGRARELAALAEEEGGGDGPAPVVDLDRDGRRIEGALRALAGAGIEELVLHGARDQPGFARAVALRWSGAVRVAPPGRDSALAPLLDDPAPILDLGGGVVRLRGPRAVPPPGARVALVGLDRDDDPLAEASAGPASVERRPYALDPARALAPWSGFLPPAAARGPAGGLRAAWRATFRARGHGAAVRCAALGLDPALEAALRSSAPQPPAGGPLVLAVTGLDGSGKSTHAAALAGALARRGVPARAVKVYRRGAFLNLAGELAARTRAGAPLAALRASRLLKLVDSIRALRDDVEPAAAACAALVFDCHAETHLAAARSQLGWDLEGHPALALFPPPALTFLLELDPALALSRVAERGEPPSADEHEVGLRGCALELDRLAAAAPARWARLDARAPMERNHDLLAVRALALAKAARRHRAAAPTLPPGRAPALTIAPPPASISPASRRARVIIGGAPGACALGEGALALCSFARARLGPAASGFPEAFWFETYAAQIVLDLRALGGAAASVALWPAALARLDLFADLSMLPELERLALAAADVEGYLPGGGPATEAALAVIAPASAPRLAAAYARALDALALERAWRPLR